MPVLLSSQFQRFCRDLHTEATAHVVDSVTPATLRPLVLARMLEARKLDRGNPNPSNLASDFRRFGVHLWAAVRARDTRNERRRQALAELSAWRNAIAHQDFDPARLTPAPPLRFGAVQRWRSACNALTRDFDRVLADQLAIVVGVRPW